MKIVVIIAFLVLLLACENSATSNSKERIESTPSLRVGEEGIYGQRHCRPGPYVHTYTASVSGMPEFYAWQVYAPNGTELNEHNDFEWNGYSNWMKISYNQYGEGTYKIKCSVRYANNYVKVFTKSIQVFKNPR